MLYLAQRVIPIYTVYIFARVLAFYDVMISQLMMRKMSHSSRVSQSSGGDLPKIDDVVFTVNQEGEMEMFEVIQAEVPDHPPGKYKQ